MAMTNEEINALTDQQINVMMTACLNHIVNYTISESGDRIYTSSEYGMHVITVKDYCNDHAAMMPIANENLIAITYGFHGGILVQASSFDSEFYSGCMESEKYCRAAAIVYLKMKGVL